MNRFYMVIFVLWFIFITACTGKESQKIQKAPLQIVPLKNDFWELQKPDNAIQEKLENVLVNTSGENNETENIVDLTILSSIMVYSEVYNMIITPEEYDGKTVKMTGMFSIYHDDIQNKYYLACLIPDAMACCQQGLEFVLADDYKYSGNYPDDGTEITVTGIFESYEEGGYNYCHLIDAKMEIK